MVGKQLGTHRSSLTEPLILILLVARLSASESELIDGFSEHPFKVH